MSGRKKRVLTISYKAPENLKRAVPQTEHEPLDALSKLVEITEPTLLLCRDALAGFGEESQEQQMINASLARIKVLKSNCLRGEPSGRMQEPGRVS